MNYSPRALESVKWNRLPDANSSCLSDSEKYQLSSFSMHGLQDLDNASLMDRVDKKFVIPRSFLSSLLDFSRAYYSVLEVSGTRISEYRNSYYDTLDYQYYREHHNQRVNRYKVRHRTYVESDASYFEVKFKDNRGRTRKTRLLMRDSTLPSDRCAMYFSAKCGCYSKSDIQSVQISSYRRISLANEAAAERLTIDANLRHLDINTGVGSCFDSWIVVEVKQNSLNRHSAFYQWAKEFALRPCSFSKYCMGIYYTGPAYLKRNNFHGVHRQLEITRRRFPSSFESV